MGSEFAYYASQIVSDIRISVSLIIVHIPVGFCSLHQCMLFQLMLPTYACTTEEKDFVNSLQASLWLVPKEVIFVIFRT